MKQNYYKQIFVGEYQKQKLTFIFAYEITKKGEATIALVDLETHLIIATMVHVPKIMLNPVAQKVLADLKITNIKAK